MRRGRRLAATSYTPSSLGIPPTPRPTIPLRSPLSRYPPLSFSLPPPIFVPLTFSFSFLLIRFVSTFVSNFTSPGSRQTQTHLTLTSPSRSARIRVCLSVSTPRRYCRIRPLWRLAAFSSTSPPYGRIPAPFFQVTNEFLYLVGVAFLGLGFLFYVTRIRAPLRQRAGRRGRRPLQSNFLGLSMAYAGKLW